MTLRERYRAKTVHDSVGEDRAWKAFALVPMMCNMPKLRSGVSLDVTAEQQRVERGQVSRARQELTGATLAPETDETLRELQGRRPQERIREIPVEVLNFVQGQALVLDATLFSKCLASAPSGSVPGSGGTNEMLKVCLDDAEVSQLFLGRPGHGQSTDPRVSQNFHACHDDSSPKEGWRSARHRDGDPFSQVGRQHVGPPVREGGRVHVCTIAIRLVNSGRHRLRGACGQGDD